MKNFKLFVFNLIIIGIAVICIASLMFASLWKVSFNVKLDDDTIGDFIGGSAEGIDLSKLDTSIEIKFSVEIKPSTVLSAFTKSDKDTLKSLIEPTVIDLEGQAKNIISKLMSSVIKMGVDMAIDELKNNHNFDDETIKQFDDIVDRESVSDIVEKALVGDMKSEAASKEIYDLIADNIGKLNIEEADKAAALEEMQGQLDGIFVEYFDEIIDEVGVINPDRTVEMILEEILKLKPGEYTSEKLIDTIVEKVPANGTKYIIIALKVLGCMVAAAALGWAFVILSALLKLLRGRGAKLWTAGLLGWIPGIVLFALPTLGLVLVKKFVPSMADMFAMFTVKFMSLSGVISLLGLAALIVLCILGFRRTRKAVDREKKMKQ